MAERIVAGKYKVIATIGRGGMAAVYRAEEVDTKRLVALKLLHLEEGAATGEREDLPEDLRDLIERFEREARAASAIETEHIVRVWDTGVDAATGAPYIAMELLEGRDLNQLLHELVALPPEVAVRLLGQALTGLAHAHKAGIVHRDLKPANLFVDDSAFGQVRVKLVDFGIAKVQKAPIATLDTHGLTQTGSVLGTPRYMSPEQIERPPRGGCAQRRLVDGRRHVQMSDRALSARRRGDPRRHADGADDQTVAAGPVGGAVGQRRARAGGAPSPRAQSRGQVRVGERDARGAAAAVTGRVRAARSRRGGAGRRASATAQGPRDRAPLADQRNGSGGDGRCKGRAGSPRPPRRQLRQR